MKIISKGKIATLLSFACIALVSGGFSSWVITNTDPIIQGVITVGNVISYDRNVIDPNTIKATGFTGVEYQWGENNADKILRYDEPLSIKINFNINKDVFNKWIQENNNSSLKIDVQSNNNYSPDNEGSNNVSVFEWFLYTESSFSVNQVDFNDGSLSNNWNTSVPVYNSSSTPTITYLHAIDTTMIDTISSCASNLVPCSFSMTFKINESPRNASGAKQSVDAYYKTIIQPVFGRINNNPFKFNGIIALGGNK